MINVNLLTHQVSHVERLMEIMKSDRSAMDFSCMGLGKTYTSTEVVVRLKLSNMFIVCPVAMESKWKQITRDHGIRNAVITSFASLRSVSGCQPKHGCLNRISVDGDEILKDGTPKKIEVFEVTKKFLKMVEDGVMLIVDEVHNLKNLSEQFRACKCLTDAIYESDVGKSRCLFLSGTPIDKEEQTLKILRLMGLYTSMEMSTAGLSTYVHKLMEKDKGTVVQLVRNTPAKIATEMVHLSHLLFKEVVCKHWVSSMPNTENNNIDCKNGYYKISERDQKFLEFYINQLHNNSGFMSLTAKPDGEGMVTIEGGKLGAIVKALEGIEQSKIPLFERLVRETLLKYPNCKICVGLNYVQRTLLSLAEKMKDLNPRLITGETSKDQRDRIISEFQQPNLKSRLLIANIKCLSTGVDLDDKTGNFPRIVYASPNYNIVDLHQFSRRFLRVDTKGVPVFRFVYGECSRKEKSILNALARKSFVLKEVLSDHGNDDVKFPGEYDDELETER